MRRCCGYTCSDAYSSEILSRAVAIVVPLCLSPFRCPARGPRRLPSSSASSPSAWEYGAGRHAACRCERRVPPVSFCFILLWLTSYFAGCFSFHRYISRLLKQECRMFVLLHVSRPFFLFHKKRQDRLVAQLAMQNLLLPCSGNIYLKHLYQEFLKNTFVKS